MSAAPQSSQPDHDALRHALDEIETQINEMRSLKGWRMNLIRESLAKARAALSVSRPHSNTQAD